MPQEFNVLRCFSCQIFQVHQVKKAKKWNCKICGEKQSILKVYGRGTGAECRGHTQKLNRIQGEAKDAIIPDVTEDHGDSRNFTGNNIPVQPTQSFGSSRWSSYINDENDTVEEDTGESSVYTTDWNEYKVSNRRKTDTKWSKKRGYPDKKDFHSGLETCFLGNANPEHKKSRKVLTGSNDFNVENSWPGLECGESGQSTSRNGSISTQTSLLKDVKAYKPTNRTSSNLHKVTGVRSGILNPQLEDHSSLKHGGVNQNSQYEQVTCVKQAKEEINGIEDFRNLIPSSNNAKLAKKKTAPQPTTQSSSRWGKFLSKEEESSSDQEAEADEESLIDANLPESNNFAVHTSSIEEVERNTGRGYCALETFGKPQDNSFNYRPGMRNVAFNSLSKTESIEFHSVNKIGNLSFNSSGVALQTSDNTHNSLAMNRKLDNTKTTVNIFQLEEPDEENAINFDL